MSGLNPIEQECRTVLAIILDLMGPGKRKVSANEHMELMGRVRDCMYRLIRKEHGCASGIHTGYCTCDETHEGKPVTTLKATRQENGGIDERH